MTIEEFWEQFRAGKIAVLMGDQEERKIFFREAEERGFRTEDFPYNLAIYPWAIFALNQVTGWTGEGGACRPSIRMSFADVQSILDGDDETDLHIEDMEDIL